MTTLIEAPSSVVLGTVDADGMPEAERSWGQWTLRGPERIRFLVPAAATRTIANLEGGGRVAITATEVDTLRSVQVKGRALLVEPPTADDLALGARYADAFFQAVHETDGSDLAALRNMLPTAFVAVECTVEATFDQTPGPTAGRCLS